MGASLGLLLAFRRVEVVLDPTDIDIDANLFVRALAAGNLRPKGKEPASSGSPLYISDKLRLRSRRENVLCVYEQKMKKISFWENLSQSNRRFGCASRFAGSGQVCSFLRQNGFECTNDVHNAQFVFGVTVERNPDFGVASNPII
jgi:hypothetical protein